MRIDLMGDRHLYYTIRMLRRQAEKNFKERLDRMNALHPRLRDLQRVNIARAAGCRDIKDVKPDDFAPMVLTHLLEEAKERGINPDSDNVPESNDGPSWYQNKDEPELDMEMPTRILELP